MDAFVVDEKCERVRESVRVKVLEYMGRAEQLKKHLHDVAEAQDKAAAAAGGGGAAGKATGGGGAAATADENAALRQTLESTIGTGALAGAGARAARRRRLTRSRRGQ